MQYVLTEAEYNDLKSKAKTRQQLLDEENKRADAVAKFIEGINHTGTISRGFYQCDDGKQLKALFCTLAEDLGLTGIAMTLAQEMLYNRRRSQNNNPQPTV